VAVQFNRAFGRGFFLIKWDRSSQTNCVIWTLTLRFTYSQPFESLRGKQLSRLRSDDFLFFVESLAPFSEEAYRDGDGARIKRSQVHQMSKYIVGYFPIKDIFFVDTSKSKTSHTYWIRKARNNEELDSFTFRETDQRIRNNAHFLRPMDRFVCAVGKNIGMKGQKRRDLFLKNALPLRTRYPFDPVEFADGVYGPLKYPRGYKWIPKIHDLKGSKYCYHELRIQNKNIGKP
jgi:hypothetical protein